MDVDELGVYDWIKPFLIKLTKGSTGLCVGGLKIEDPVSSAAPRPNYHSTNENDIFNIAVPFAGDIIRWQFILDGTDPGNSPDLLFPEYDDFDPEYDDITSLSNWDCKNDDSLLIAVKQVVSLYKEHHKQKCFQLGSKFKEELEALLEHENKYNIEICLKKSDRTGNQRVVNLLIQLHADFTGLFEADATLDGIIYSPLLLIKYEIDAGKVVPNLYMPSHVGPVIAAPAYIPGMTILDYVLKTNEKLRESVKIMRESHGKRCEYIAAFLRLFAGHTVEYDAEKFLKISFLFSFQTFYFFLHVNLTKFFPSEQPVLTLQSAYHLNRRNQPYQSVCANYPYSPRWNGAEMAKRAKSFIRERVSVFKENCIRNGVLS